MDGDASRISFQKLIHDLKGLWRVLLAGKAAEADPIVGACCRLPAVRTSLTRVADQPAVFCDRLGAM
jgi:hypothetical protein